MLRYWCESMVLASDSWHTVRNFPRMGARKDIQPMKNHVQLNPKDSLLKQAQEESEWEPRITQVTAIKQRLFGNTDFLKHA